MKLKKVYIGIAAIVICLVLGCIFCIINVSNKDVEIGQFNSGNLKEDTKEAMNEERVSQNKNTDEKKEEETKREEQIEENEDLEDEKKEEEPETEIKEEQAPEVQTKVEEPKKIEVTPLTKTMYVNVDSLNIRSGPDTTYSKLGSYKKADEVSITGKAEEWYRISYKGKEAFVMARYLSATKPVIEAPAPVTNVSESATGSANNLIIINSRANTLRYYVNGNLSRSYRCATGASGTQTPTGKFQIFEKLVNRPYYKLNIPGGAPNNPLGPRWMQFKSGGYAIHGTNTDSSIGTNASHGCVRMHNSDVIELYSLVPMGTTVIVKSTTQSDQEIAAGYGIHIN